VLPAFDIAGAYGREINGQPLTGWYFLRGSATPRASEEEARRLLEPVARRPAAGQGWAR
jgi:hypothetical protein